MISKISWFIMHYCKHVFTKCNYILFKELAAGINLCVPTYNADLLLWHVMATTTAETVVMKTTLIAILQVLRQKHRLSRNYDLIIILWMQSMLNFSVFVFSISVVKRSRVKILRVPTKWGCQKQMFGHLDNEDDYFALFLQGEFVRLWNGAAAALKIKWKQRI